MVYKAMLSVCLIVFTVVRDSLQHGYMIDPPSRSSLWRVNKKAPANYNDNRLYCGGRSKIQQFGGLCGPCGDPYDGERENEAGGKYALGIISKKLPDGARILETKVVNTAFHKGYYEFRICANNDVTRAVTQECLNENLMTVMEGDDKYPTRFYPPGPGEHLVHVNLPEGMKCSQCVVQWRYRTGNSWGRDLDGTECIGCGVQEEFRNCADISIGSSGGADDKDHKTQENNYKETVEPLITESNINPRFRALETFATNSLNKRSTTTTTTTMASPVIREDGHQTDDSTTFMVNDLWSRSQFVRPRISINMNRREESPSTSKPAPRISFLDPTVTTTESTVTEPVTTARPSMEARLEQIRKLQRLAALAMQMKTLLNTLRHLPVFQNLNLGTLDKELIGQKEAPWNNLARPTTTTKQPTQTRTFPWESGMSLNQIKSNAKSTTSKNPAHILQIPPSRVSFSRFNYPILPPPNPLLTGQFRREKTRTVVVDSGNDKKTNVEEAKPSGNQEEEEKKVMPLYKNEFNVISPESLEGEISIKDWYKKIVKLMVQKKMPVAEIKRMVDRLKQIKDVHKTQPLTMLEKLRKSELPATESSSDNAVVSSDNNFSSTKSTAVPSDNSLSSRSTASLATNAVYPEVQRRITVRVEKTPSPVTTKMASRNVLYPEGSRLQQEQRARDISAIPPNINTVRGNQGPRDNTYSNPYVDYSDDTTNQITPPKRGSLHVKLRNFMELNPQFRVPFGAVFH